MGITFRISVIYPDENDDLMIHKKQNITDGFFYWEVP